MVKNALAESGLDLKSMLRCRNIFALGLVCWLFDRPLESALHLLKNKFAKKPAVYEANAKVLNAGYDYGHNIHASVSTYRIETSDTRPGTYTDVNGNTATAWGLIYASEKSGRPLYLGSLPYHSCHRHPSRTCKTQGPRGEGLPDGGRDCRRLLCYRRGFCR